ncbi:unnamed protein product, partial [marine sediment metagenome]
AQSAVELFNMGFRVTCQTGGARNAGTTDWIEALKKAREKIDGLVELGPDADFEDVLYARRVYR